MHGCLCLHLPYDVDMQESSALKRLSQLWHHMEILHRMHSCPYTEVRAHDHRIDAYRVIWQHLSWGVFTLVIDLRVRANTVTNRGKSHPFSRCWVDPALPGFML